MGMRWLGRPDLASRALKTVHWTVFAPRDADAGHGLFKFGLSFPSTVYHNKKRCNPIQGCIFWLGRPDLNRRMEESKSSALPLGDGPL